MPTEERTIKVRKITNNELDKMRGFLQELESVISENSHYEEDSEINKEISDIARTIPDSSFIFPLNLSILLDNYQDTESEILQHPKWIIQLYEKIEYQEKQIADLKNKLHKK